MRSSHAYAAASCQTRPEAIAYLDRALFAHPVTRPLQAEPEGVYLSDGLSPLRGSQR